MKVYRATVTDKCASPSGEEPASYESYVAVGGKWEIENYGEIKTNCLPDGIKDEQIHYYFTTDEFRLEDGTISTEDFTYTVGERVA